jgi:hypothetical protein
VSQHCVGLMREGGNIRKRARGKLRGIVAPRQRGHEGSHLRVWVKRAGRAGGTRNSAICSLYPEVPGCSPGA